MRKIESVMIAALKHCMNKTVGNTSVTHTGGLTGIQQANVYLHGHMIAIVDYTTVDDRFKVTGLRVSLAGWNTSTTRSRLSALVREFSAIGDAGLGVSTRQGQPYIHDASGKHAMESTGWFGVVLQ